MPALEQLHRELGNRGLSVLGVNFREDAQVVHRYVQELNLTFPLLLDPGFARLFPSTPGSTTWTTATYAAAS